MTEEEQEFSALLSGLMNSELDPMACVNTDF